MNEKEKQIEEMEKVIADAFMADYNIGCDPCTGTVATALYLEGYRKQSAGEWKLGKSGCMYFCSECNYAAHPREVDEWSYCPRCGAKMGGGAE